jgi:hypothetical protein
MYNLQHDDEGEEKDFFFEIFVAIKYGKFQL